MANPSETIDYLPLQFRTEHEPVPMVGDFDQLGDAIETRVKPGLDDLLTEIDINTVEYAGYALLTYLFPQQRLEFMFPEQAESLKLALVGIDMDVASGPQPNPQDLYIHFGDSFDVSAIARRSPDKWREGVFTQRNLRDMENFGTFKDHMFILGSLVRTYVDGLPDHDRYNQPENMHFKLRHAVAISGEVLLPGLYGLYPKLREGWAIPEGYTPELLTTMFQLAPEDTTWLDYHVALENYWKAHQPYPSDPHAAYLASLEE